MAVPIEELLSTLKYDPDQPRDDQGQWSETGAEGKARLMANPKLEWSGDPYQVKKKEEMEAKAAELLDKAKVYIAIQPATLETVFRDGTFKSQLDTNTSGAALDPAMRRSFENGYFGESHVIYGYMSENGISGPTLKVYTTSGKEAHLDAVHAYGTARVELKSSVRDRTSFVQGDTLDLNVHTVLSSSVRNKIADKPSALVIPSSIDAPSYKSFVGANKLMAARTISEANYTYVEAQVRGGVSVKDIAHVTFYRKKPSETMVEQLKAAGIHYSFRGKYAESSP